MIRHHCISPLVEEHYGLKWKALAKSEGHMCATPKLQAKSEIPEHAYQGRKVTVLRAILANPGIKSGVQLYSAAGLPQKTCQRAKGEFVRDGLITADRQTSIGTGVNLYITPKGREWLKEKGK